MSSPPPGAEEGGPCPPVVKALILTFWLSVYAYLVWWQIGLIVFTSKLVYTLAVQGSQDYFKETVSAMATSGIVMAAIHMAPRVLIKAVVALQAIGGGHQSLQLPD